MWITFVTMMIAVIGLPPVWYLSWQGKFLPENRRGVRLEIHREQIRQHMKMFLPAWGMLVLLAIGQLVELYAVSRHLRDFWDGFLVASSLFLIGFQIVNLISLRHQEQEKRRQRSRNRAGVDIP